MRAADVDILLVPGWTGAGPDHWMSRWQTKLTTASRVVQDDVDLVDKAKWTTRLIEHVARARRPVVLVAHSCGVATVAHAAPHLPKLPPVVAAFLVAPSSEAATAALPHMDPAFAVYPRAALPFPSLLVASRTDEHCPYEAAADLASAWGADLVDAGDSGHLNTASGHGPWPEGVLRLATFLQKLGPLTTTTA